MFEGGMKQLERRGAEAKVELFDPSLKFRSE